MALTQVDPAGRPRMVDVGAKPPRRRTAKAEGRIRLEPATVRLIRASRIAKGNVLATAELAGIQAAKQTPAMIPLCHPVPLSGVRVEARLEAGGCRVTAEASCTGQTGVEMEALAAVSVALLTVYDMCKAVDRKLELGGIRLLEKRKAAP